MQGQQETQRVPVATGDALPREHTEHRHMRYRTHFGHKVLAACALLGLLGWLVRAII